jgi:hypothetical protein
LGELCGVTTLQQNRTKDMSHPDKKMKRQRRKDTTFHESSNRGDKIIRLPCDEAQYAQAMVDAAAFRSFLDGFIAQMPELFPPQVRQGYTLHDIRFSRRQQLFYRRISCGRVRYTIEPAFITPYWTAKCEQVWYPLLLLNYGVPYWLITMGFGRHDDFWYRLFRHLGRFNLVATTARRIAQVPVHLAADEKISFWHGQEMYICTTAAQGCVWGMEPSRSEDVAGLSRAYGVFKQEALELQPAYEALSVNTDGWTATRNTWKKLFDNVVLILCFLHGFIKIRQRAAQMEHKQQLFDKVWNAYRQETKDSFCLALQQLQEWNQTHNGSPTCKLYVDRLCQKAEDYASAYGVPQGYRTSNTVDRPLRRLDRFLFVNQYFHGHFASAQLLTRAFALCLNFIPFCPRSQYNKPERGYSRAVQYNRFSYSNNWLINLLSAASLNGKNINPQMS